MAELDVAIVAVERKIWSGKATFSVTEAGVTVLAELAEFASEIDADEAKTDAASDDPQIAARGRARLRALGQLD